MERHHNSLGYIIIFLGIFYGSVVQYCIQEKEGIWGKNRIRKISRINWSNRTSRAMGPTEPSNQIKKHNITKQTNNRANWTNNTNKTETTKPTEQTELTEQPWSAEPTISFKFCIYYWLSHIILNVGVPGRIKLYLVVNATILF